MNCFMDDHVHDQVSSEIEPILLCFARVCVFGGKVKLRAHMKMMMICCCCFFLN